METKKNLKIKYDSTLDTQSTEFICEEDISFFEEKIKNEVNYMPSTFTDKSVDNKYMWILATVPILGAIIDLIAGTTSFLPVIIANTILCSLDKKKLQATGHPSPKHWALFIVPIYIWKRATLLYHEKNYFWAWVVALIISTVI